MAFPTDPIDGGTGGGGAPGTGPVAKRSLVQRLRDNWPFVLMAVIVAGIIIYKITN